LVTETNLTAAIGVLQGGQVVLVDIVESPELLRINPRMGYEFPLYAAALGKVLIALPPREQVLSVYLHDETDAPLPIA
jgi:IclR family acetate operon transcriptional repressor